MFLYKLRTATTTPVAEGPQENSKRFMLIASHCRHDKTFHMFQGRQIPFRLLSCHHQRMTYTSPNILSTLSMTTDGVKSVINQDKQRIGALPACAHQLDIRIRLIVLQPSNIIVESVPG